MTKIFIATPAHGEVFYAPYVQSLVRLQKVIDKSGWDSNFATVAYFDICESRNYLLTRWFDKTDATHLLFIDADMGFDPQAVVQMLALNKPLAGVIYPKRQIDLGRLAALAAQGENAERAIASAHEFIQRPIRGRTARRDKGFVEVEACGTGLMLIRRDCIETMLQKMPELSHRQSGRGSPFSRDLARMIRAFDFLTVDGARLSDDYSFCHRWRQCGGEIWAGADQTITHVGPYHFRARFSDARRPGPRIRVGQIAKPRAGGNGAKAGDAAKPET